MFSACVKGILGLKTSVCVCVFFPGVFLRYVAWFFVLVKWLKSCFLGAFYVAF